MILYNFYSIKNIFFIFFICHYTNFYYHNNITINVLIYFRTKGTLPTEIGSLTNLEVLGLYENEFTGIIAFNNKIMMKL